MANVHDHGGQKGSTQHGETDPEETGIVNSAIDKQKFSGQPEQRSGESTSQKENAEKGDPDNPSETTGATESGDEDKGAK